MRPPAKKRIDSETVPAPADPRAADSRTEALQEKAKLAQHLHAQGVNPVRWTEAHPAPQSDQATFRTTGLKPKDNQFEVGGKLYDWSPAVTATPQQARAIADAYIAERSGKDGGTTPTLKIEDLVDIGEVPLRHPIGTPHHERPANDMSIAEERTALIRHYAQSGVDPDKAHLGDPVDRKAQERLKAKIEKTLPGDKSEISGLPLFYQGFDDGWIYQANASTRESDEVQKIRNEHSDKMLQRRDDDAPVAINDNDVATEDRIVEHYNARASQSAPAIGKPPSEEERNALARQQLDEMSRWMPALIKVVEKTQRGESLTDKELYLTREVNKRFAEVGVWFDPKGANLEFLREAAKAVERTKNYSGSRAPLHFLALATNAGVAQALVNGSMDWARLAQVGWPEGFGQAARLLQGSRIKRLLRIATTAANMTDIITTPNDEGLPDLLSLPFGGVDEVIEGVSSTLDGEDASLELHPTEVTSTEQGQRQKELTPPTPKTLEALRAGLSDVKDFEVLIGGIPLFKQSERKTLMDEIFRTELIKIAQEKGCLPKPNDPDAKEKFHDYGGSKPQQRITDIDQDGHLGSRQPDSGMRWKNPDKSWTEVLWNSTTPLANGFTEILREWRALTDIVKKADKHLAFGDNLDELYKFTEKPILGKGPVYHMAEKPTWTEQELRDFISKKLRERFDKDFKDCKFIGENRIVKLDHPDDPDLPLSPR